MPFTFPETIVKNPLTMLCFYDESIQLGVDDENGTKLDKWQKDLLLYLGQEHKKNDPAIQAMLLAANGSGKTKYIIAPFVIWMTMKYPESRTVVTTSSGTQLDNQDLLFVTKLANKINTFHKDQFPEGVITCQYRKIINKVTESDIIFFATDDTGKAEGWHPIKPNGKFALVIDEGKTVDDEIYEAIENCTGFSHRLDSSSAGQSSGQYYLNWHNRELDSYIRKIRVTAFDCGHIKLRDIEQRIKKYGSHHPRIRNSVFSEFTSADQQVVIPRELLIKSSNLCNKHYSFGPLRAGLDLAMGGDENSMSVWDGNKEIASKNWKKSDATEAVDDIVNFILSFKGTLKAENIYADDSGCGRPMLDILRKAGYPVNRILNQARAFDSTHYANRGTELWWTFKRFIEEYQVLFLKNDIGDMDSALLSQMSNRYYKTQDASGKLLLESKQKAKAEGHPSPDRADSVVLAWSPFVYPVVEMSGAVEVNTKKIYTPEDWYLEQRNKEMALMRNQNNNARKFKTTYQPHQLRASSVLSYRNIYKNRLASKS